MIHDPRMNGAAGADDASRGLYESRQFLLQLAGRGMPAGFEFVSPHVAGYVSDLVTWGSVGARTVASQAHRQLAAGLPMPVGFKNPLDGDVGQAVNACTAAAARHAYIGAGDAGPAAVTADGNPDTVVVLRGAHDGPNYSAGHVAGALGMIRAAGLPARVMVDASHGNSRKDFRRQPEVAAAVAAQVAAGNDAITGVMLESFLTEGKQDPGPPDTLAYGQSVTDACMDLEMTDRVLAVLAAGAAHRAGRL
jgi:3-deoxy-7-phosphoheptulonate synthase